MIQLNYQVRGVLVLFQAVKPLMPKGGKFITISSGAGTIGKEMNSGNGTYGLTKVSWAAHVLLITSGRCQLYSKSLSQRNGNG
jgi:NAD(P)-dependent dehydrogenase (short-subunit alcohol dehydrogenase family)